MSLTTGPFRIRVVNTKGGRFTGGLTDDQAAEVAAAGQNDMRVAGEKP